jgi:dephospho-CoA kinase
MAVLNAITHPPIVEEIEREKEEIAGTWGDKPGLLVIDAPLLVEVGLHKGVDEIWTVAVEPQTPIERLMKRDGLSEAAARKRVESQMPQAEKLKFAHRIINNDGPPDETIQQIRRYLAELEK